MFGVLINVFRRNNQIMTYENNEILIDNHVVQYPNELLSNKISRTHAVPYFEFNTDISIQISKDQKLVTTFKQHQERLHIL